MPTSKPHAVATEQQRLEAVQMIAQLAPEELQALTQRLVETGRSLATVTPDELEEWLEAAASRPAPATEPASDAGDWSELEEFLDDTLMLRYQGAEYRLQAADIDTGLECQLLLGVGARLRANRQPSEHQRDRLEDADETELFIRLLGGQPQLEDGHPNPRYSVHTDVWKQLHDEGRSWAFVQHVGTTAIFWAAFGTDAALEFWKSGGRRPKAAPQPPAPKLPQDRKAPATTTPALASGSSTSPKRRAARKGTPGQKSSGDGA